jgi:hypothetical protein
MTEVDPRIKQIWETFLSYEIEHLRIAAEMLRKHEGKDAEALFGTDLPTPATFETNREYVTKVIKETADLRLIEGGQWAKIAELPRDWPSHRYQEIVHAAGAPSEGVVTLRMKAAGAELVRTGDPSLAPQAGAIRVGAQDGATAPNTAPEKGDMALSMAAEIERLGELADDVEDYTLSSSNGKAASSRTDGAASGRRRANGAQSTDGKASAAAKPPRSSAGAGRRS